MDEFATNLTGKATPREAGNNSDLDLAESS